MTHGVIDSPHNRQIAAARALLTRKGRVRASAVLVEGPHAVLEVLAAPEHRVRAVFATRGCLDHDAALLRQARLAGIDVQVVSERVLASLRDTVTPQGVVAVVEMPQTDLATVLAAGLRLGVLLEQIADPGNAGTVIRTADAAGAGGVVVGGGSVDVWSGKCVRASAGSVFHLPVITGISAPDAARQIGSAGVTVLATAADGGVDLDRLIDSGELAKPTVWLFGNEARGLSVQARAEAAQVVRLPVYGRAESLNLAAAAAVCMYASARAQRR